MDKTTYLLDSNAIIDINNIEKCTENIKDHIKGKNPKIVIPAQVSKELKLDRYSEDTLGEREKVWSGKDEKRIREILKDKIGVSVKFYTLDNNIKKKAKELFKNYDDLEHSDAFLLSSMLINKKWNEIVTHDTDLKICCDKENVNFFDHLAPDGKWSC